MSVRDIFGEKANYTTQEEISYFRQRCPIGQELNCMIFEGEEDSKHSTEVKAKCTVLHKGRHNAITDQGTMQWALLTIWNKALLREWRYMDKKFNEIKGGKGA